MVPKTIFMGSKVQFIILMMIGSALWGDQTQPAVEIVGHFYVSRFHVIVTRPEGRRTMTKLKLYMGTASHFYEVPLVGAPLKSRKGELLRLTLADGAALFLPNPYFQIEYASLYIPEGGEAELRRLNSKEFSKDLIRRAKDEKLSNHRPLYRAIVDDDPKAVLSLPCGELLERD